MRTTARRYFRTGTTPCTEKGNALHTGQKSSNEGAYLQSMGNASGVTSWTSRGGQGGGEKSKSGGYPRDIGRKHSRNNESCAIHSVVICNDKARAREGWQGETRWAQHFDVGEIRGGISREGSGLNQRTDLGSALIFIVVWDGKKMHMGAAFFGGETALVKLPCLIVA